MRSIHFFLVFSQCHLHHLAPEVSKLFRWFTEFCTAAFVLRIDFESDVFFGRWSTLVNWTRVKTCEKGQKRWTIQSLWPQVFDDPLAIVRIGGTHWSLSQQSCYWTALLSSSCHHGGRPDIAHDRFATLVLKILSSGPKCSRERTHWRYCLILWTNILSSYMLFDVGRICSFDERRSPSSGDLWESPCQGHASRCPWADIRWDTT